LAKIWDILPPPPRPAPKSKKTTARKRTLSLWYLVILVVFSFVFVFGGSWAKLKYFDNISSTSPTPSPSQNSQASKTQENLSIKILNSTGRFEEATKVKDILINKGFNVSATETAVNTYDQTIVYYTSNNSSTEKYALEIADLLKSYNAKTQKFSQGSSYDIAIIIGGKF